uniref:PDZ domain-containing protein n=1 Tax=Macrostomum lignano TaxID=282301 RepID=A0A1I8F8A2_9PLAT
KSVVIYEILDSGAASREPSLREGDRILSVDDRDLTVLTHDEAKAALRQCGRTVRLTVQHGRGPIAEAELYDFGHRVWAKSRAGASASALSVERATKAFSCPIFIRGGAAEGDGRLQPGDRLLEADGCNVRLLPHVEVATRLKAAQGRISMLVGRLKHVSAASRAKRRPGF